MKNKSRKSGKKVVMVSGGFDPVHIGHVRLFQEAKKLGDELVVVINNDNWKRKKRRHVFMPDVERKEIIQAFACVDKVLLTSHPKDPQTPKDMSVCKELLKVRPHIFANGGDRNEKDAADPNSSLYSEVKLCEELGIEIVFNIGHGGKVRSSSELLKEYAKNIEKTKKKK